jgi:hypothetical protein
LPSGDQAGPKWSPLPAAIGRCCPVATSTSQIDYRTLSVMLSADRRR